MTEQLIHNLRQTVREGRLVEEALPLCPALSLYLLSTDYPKGRLPEDEMHAIMEAPAYWAFCWASGQVLARHLLLNPEICRGKTVLDLGAGSGVVAIAALKAGAERAIACDIDPMALDACRCNAELNGVRLELSDDLNDLAEKVDLLIAADVLYDRDNLCRLEHLQDYANEILIADSRIGDVSVFENYTLIDELDATTIPDLDELKEFGHVRIYHQRH